MLRMHGAIPPLPNTSSWRDDFTLPPTEVKFSFVETMMGRCTRAQQGCQIENMPVHVVALAYECEKFKEHC
jgi:hypothetical protein